MNSKLIAVNDSNAATGEIVYFRFEGTVGYDELCDAWEAQGDFPRTLLPQPCTQLNALRRAFLSSTRKRLIMRPLGRGVKGFALVDEDAKGEDLDHGVAIKGIIRKPESDDQAPRVEWVGDDDLIDRVRTKYEDNLHDLDARALSMWLVAHILPACQSVALRPGGGVYFIPANSDSLYKHTVAVLKSVSEHKFFTVPVVESEDAIEAIFDAITQEAAQAAEEMEKALEGDEIGKRAAEGRVETVRRLEGKLAMYEKLLDCKAPAMHERLDQLRSQMAEVALGALDADSAE